MVATSVGLVSVGLTHGALAQGTLVASVPGKRLTPERDGLRYAQFDTDILRSRGLDPSIAEYFRSEARFAPGQAIVQVSVNGVVQGRKSARFGKDGELCFTPEFVRAIGLAPMKSDSADKPSESADRQASSPARDDAQGSPEAQGPAAETRLSVPASCPDYRTFVSRAVVTLDPGNGAVDIVVPPEFVTTIGASTVEHGGTAALLNYRAFVLESGFNGGARSSYRQLDSMLGFNLDDWIVRSRQYYTRGLGHSRFQWQEAYAQRTFVDQAQILQFGRTWTQDPLFGGVAFTGAQWIPESALRAGTGATVTGVANGRARVEVRQNGVLLYSTVVPPGPFTLRGIQTHNTSTDLQVQVIEDNGAAQEFIVPAATLLLNNDAALANGYSMAVGRFWDPSETDSIRGGVLASASKGWNYGGYVSGIVGGLVANGYSALGTGVNMRLGSPRHSFYIQVLTARDSTHNLSGIYGSFAFMFAPADFLHFGLSGNARTVDYRTVQEAHSSVLSQSPYHTQLGTSVTWNTGLIGAFSASVTRQSYFDSSAGYLVGIGWNISLGKAQLAVGGSYNTRRTLYTRVSSVNGGTFDTTVPSGSTPIYSSNYLYATLTIPLGHNVTSNTYYRRSESGQSTNSAVGSSMQQQVNDIFGYTATVEKNLESNESPNGSFTANVIPRYTSATLGLSAGQNSGSFYGQMSGAVVVQGRGVSLSPYPVQDTFGVLKVGEMAGIRIDTPQGPVWSGYDGLTVLPGLIPFRDSRIEVAGTSIPKDVDVDNALQVVDAGRGAVLELTMGAKRVRRILLAVSNGEGKALSEGLAVIRNDDEFLGATLSDGRVMLTDLKDNDRYRIQLTKDRFCTLQDFKVEPPRGEQPFERGTARCD
ncbi:fimbria/pilus outer membrane usher protein [Burkholderia territorii]|uniref:fimbria/pilus outer membrane usher protein n=1 Tax=Burkholderia territorii TaxID=1503055 RepID=UPI0007BAAFF7|nr:fimbria/pilus outer membrane usher protein [Burkholderia territorii]